MPKRKRPSPSPSAEEGFTALPKLLARQKKLTTAALTKSHKSLVSALRLGAGFERQKYSRRRKTAKEKKDEKATARLDAEYAVLKTLDMPKLAEQHLRKTIAKVKSLKDQEGLPDNVCEIEKGTQDSAALNVTARLYKVPAVKKVVDECIDQLKIILGVSGEKKGEAPSKKRKGEDDAVDKKDRKDKQARKEEVEGDDSDVNGGIDADFEAQMDKWDALIAAPSSADEDSDGSLSDGHRPPSVVEELDGEDEDFGSEDESEAEFTASGDDSDVAIPRDGYIVTDQDDSDDSQDDELTAPKTKAKKKMEKPSSSTFLPSLSHANYYSGSESEASDLDDIAPKKNRRGQRARQKIWEAKYGEKAKHVQKDERNKGWDAKKGAVSNDRGGKGRVRGGRGPERTGENAIELVKKKPTKRDDSGPLHPSWQAAKLAKEKKLTAKPQGTKISFD